MVPQLERCMISAKHRDAYFGTGKNASMRSTYKAFRDTLSKYSKEKRALKYFIGLTTSPRYPEGRDVLAGTVVTTKYGNALEIPACMWVRRKSWDTVLKKKKRDISCFKKTCKCPRPPYSTERKRLSRLIGAQLEPHTKVLNTLWSFWMWPLRQQIIWSAYQSFAAKKIIQAFARPKRDHWSTFIIAAWVFILSTLSAQ